MYSPAAPWSQRQDVRVRHGLLHELAPVSCRSLLALLMDQDRRRDQQALQLMVSLKACADEARLHVPASPLRECSVLCYLEPCGVLMETDGAVKQVAAVDPALCARACRGQIRAGGEPAGEMISELDEMRCTLAGARRTTPSASFSLASAHPQRSRL